MRTVESRLPRSCPEGKVIYKYTSGSKQCVGGNSTSLPPTFDNVCWDATGIYWGEVRDTAKHPMMHKPAPHNQELSSPESPSKSIHLRRLQGSSGKRDPGQSYPESQLEATPEHSFFQQPLAPLLPVDRPTGKTTGCLGNCTSPVAFLDCRQRTCAAPAPARTRHLEPLPKPSSHRSSQHAGINMPKLQSS